MAANDVPTFYMFDFGFLSFLALCAVAWGVWRLKVWFFGR